jgi:hypothetical protein
LAAQPKKAAHNPEGGADNGCDLASLSAPSVPHFLVLADKNSRTDSDTLNPDAGVAQD